MNEQRTITAQAKRSTSISSVTAPMTKQQATLLVARMLGSYSTLNLHNPQVYMPELATTLMKYPFSIGERGCEMARKASPEFIPSVGSIQAECEKLFAGTREATTWAKQWQQRATEQLRERAEYESRPRTPPTDDRPLHSRANVFVGQHLPQYAEMKTRSEAKDVNPNDFYFGHNADGVVGIWVSLGWCERMMGGRRDSGLAHVSTYGAPG